MSFEDFVKYFGEIGIVNLNPMRTPSNADRRARAFNKFTVKGEGLKDVNGEEAKTNPQYK